MIILSYLLFVICIYIFYSIIFINEYLPANNNNVHNSSGKNLKKKISGRGAFGLNIMLIKNTKP